MKKGLKLKKQLIIALAAAVLAGAGVVAYQINGQKLNSELTNLQPTHEDNEQSSYTNNEPLVCNQKDSKNQVAETNDCLFVGCSSFF